MGDGDGEGDGWDLHHDAWHCCASVWEPAWWMDCTPHELCERLSLFPLPTTPFNPPPHPPAPPFRLPKSFRLLQPPPISRSSFTSLLLLLCYHLTHPKHIPGTPLAPSSPSSPITPPPPSSLCVSPVDSVMRALVEDGALGDLPLDRASVRCRDGGGRR